MTKILVLAWAGFVIGTTGMMAGTPAQAGFVNGYYRSNGTYVAPYYRGPADGLCFNNKAGC